MSGSGIGQFIPLILIFVIFYFFLIRPQQKKVKEHKLMVENLKRGDKVITSIGTFDPSGRRIISPLGFWETELIFRKPDSFGWVESNALWRARSNAVVCAIS